MDYIKKEDMKIGWYKGFCRNAYFAFWNGKEFMYIRYKFEYRWDEIEHFDDIRDTRADGFVPVERVEIEDIKETHPKEVFELKNCIDY